MSGGRDEAVDNPALKELRQSASKTPDPVATEDREAVAAAVRGSSKGELPAGHAPNYTNLSDAEFLAAISTAAKNARRPERLFLSP